MKVIFETLVGSHLYGTNTPESDLDICGIFMPTADEILGLGEYPLEISLSKKKSTGPRNAAGDVDHKLYSLKRFLILAKQGQPGALEMLFSSPVNARVNTSLWMKLLDLRDSAIVSKRGIAPFLGFAQAQAEKMVRRGEKYNSIVNVLAALEAMPAKFLKEQRLDDIVKINAVDRIGYASIFGEEANRYKNDHDATLVRFAGSNYDVKISLRLFRRQLIRKEERYGTRSKAAALEHLDYKSLLHCMRLLTEAEEFITTGNITLPRPDHEREFLLSIKRREWPPEGQDVFGEVTDRIRRIRESVVPRSKLRDVPDEEAIQRFLIDAHVRLINGEELEPWPKEIKTAD